MEDLFGDKVQTNDERVDADDRRVIANNQDLESQGIALVELELKERDNVDKQQSNN